MSRGLIWTSTPSWLGSGYTTVSGNYAGTGTSATNASITLNTAGLAISVGAITLTGTYAGTGVTTNTITGNNINLTLNTLGLNMSYPAFSSMGGTGGWINLDGGYPDSVYGGISLIDAGGIT